MELLYEKQGHLALITRCAPLAARSIKRCLQRTEGMSLGETEDYQEGRRAFFEKRPPQFKAR